jgi:hypothetical protein
MLIPNVPSILSSSSSSSVLARARSARALALLLVLVATMMLLLVVVVVVVVIGVCIYTVDIGMHGDKLDLDLYPKELADPFVWMFVVSLALDAVSVRHVLRRRMDVKQYDIMPTRILEIFSSTTIHADI